MQLQQIAFTSPLHSSGNHCKRLEGIFPHQPIGFTAIYTDQTDSEDCFYTDQTDSEEVVHTNQSDSE